MIRARTVVAAVAFVVFAVGGGLASMTAIGTGAVRASPLSATSLHAPMGATIEFRVAWDWSGARWDEGARAYAFRTDRGYDVTLAAARVGLAELELVPCAQASLGSLFAPREALANHGGMHDASLVAGAIAESPFELAEHAFGTSHASGRTYCRVHALIAPLESTEGASVSLRGSFAVPGEPAPRALDARVGLAGGALVDLQVDDRLAGLAGDRAAPIRIVVRRDAARALDGVDLAQLSSSEIAYAFLRGLAHASSATARPAQGAM